MPLAFIDVSAIWLTALAALPIAIGVAVTCRVLPLRPATRHSLWLATLLTLFLPILLPNAPVDAVAEQLQTARSSLASLVDAATADSIEVPDSAPATGASPGDTRSNAGVVDGYPDLTGNVQLPWNRPQLDSVARLETAGIDRGHRRPRGSSGGRSSTSFVPTELDSASSATNENGFAVRSIAAAPSPTAHDQPEPLEPRTSVEPSAAPASSGAEGSARDRALAWLGAVRAAVTAVAIALYSLPTVPPVIWLSGVGLLAALYLVRAASFRTRLRSALPAPAHVRAMVETAAKTIGLAAAPQTVLTDARVSPLIWVGRRPVLVLPTGLWGQLDKAGRRAILFHELAHLKRRDHWVAWIELFASLLYWWHPLVWWVRRRIHEEADLSCDAWVTWTLPQGRRAYAEALLRARQYISDGRVATPIGGMAAAGARARTFARRLTMVMTRSVRPRTSMLGFLLAAAVAGLGWFATPALAQAFSGGGAAAAPSGSSGSDDEKVRVRFHAPKADAESDDDDDEDESGDADAPTGLFFSGARTTGAGGGGRRGAPAQQGGGDLYRRMDQLELQLRMISEQLAELRGSLPGTPRGMGVFGGGAGPQPPAAPGAPSSPPSGMRVARPRGGASVTTPAPGGGSAGAMGGRMGGGFGGPAVAGPLTATSDGPTIIREYPLPDGKLDAFYQLMVRNDVPIPVSKGNNSITVHATESQHRVVKAFLEMINPSGRAGAAGPSNPLAAAELATAARNQKADAARTLAAMEQALAQGRMTEANRKRVAELRALAAEEAGRAQVRNLLDVARARADEERAHAEAMERDAEAMNSRAEQLAAEAEALSESAGEMMEAEGDGTSRKERRENAEQLRKQSRELQQQIRELEKKVRELERQRERVESAGDAAEELAEELEEFLANAETVGCADTEPVEMVEFSPMPAELSAASDPAPVLAPTPAIPPTLAAPTRSVTAVVPAVPAAPTAPPAGVPVPSEPIQPVTPEPTPAPR